MSDYYWPSTTPNTIHISYVTQVKYTIHLSDAGYFEVKATNRNIETTDHRTWLPEYYINHFIKFLFRFDLCIRLWNTYHGKKMKAIRKRIPRLVRIMCHLDNVGESFIRPTINIPKENINNWRCKNFEEYLVTEFLLGRHDPAIVKQFRSTTRMNIERIPLQGLDWETYDSCRINKKLDGRHYDYNINNVPRDHLGELWKLLEQHYSRPLDPEWVSLWTTREHGETNQVWECEESECENAWGDDESDDGDDEIEYGDDEEVAGEEEEEIEDNFDEDSGDEDEGEEREEREKLVAEVLGRAEAKAKLEAERQRKCRIK